MRVVVATVQVPFIDGGAEKLTRDLLDALKAAGHIADALTMPFTFHPLTEIRRAMNRWADESLTGLYGGPPDRVICLKFPAYYLNHPGKVAWLAHQHRQVYDLWDTEIGAAGPRDADAAALKDEITQRDNAALRSCHRVFTISKTVTARMRRFNGVESGVLYPPLPDVTEFYSRDPQPYIFFPSRLEDLKRQSLLVEAMRHVKSPVCAVFSGEGGCGTALHELVQRHNLGMRVRFLGRVRRELMLACYANSLGVFFGPYDEDYGYVTLEAMASAKPVITCSDSGGPTEFVLDGETGLVVPPEPKAVAEAIDRLHDDRLKAATMGYQGRERLMSLDMSWARVVEALLD